MVGKSQGKNRIMPVETILQKLGQAFTCQGATRIFKKMVAHIGIQTDDLEEMTIAVAGDG